MPLTADSSLSRLIEPILATELLYGERAYGPCFLLDLKLFSDPTPPQSVAATYKLVQEIYTETPIAEAHQEALLSTIDRDQASESWNAEEAVSELQPEHFKEWLHQSLLAKEDYVIEDSEIEDAQDIDNNNENPLTHAYINQQNAVTQLTDYIQPLLFQNHQAIKLYSLTDTNNENTPYGVYLAIGQTHTLLVVSHWIL